MPTGDAIARLKDDHDEVRRLFAEYEKLGDRAAKSKAELAGRICTELAVHAAIEEQVFYPRVRAAGKQIKDEVLEAVEEHALIKQLVAEIEALTPDAESYDAKVQVLGEQVEHHAGEEESDMFPRVRKALTEAELMDLGAQLGAAKAEQQRVLAGQR